ncbi:MAG: malectin domain-containing carbohydrate-binding protein [Candidatus Sumerlaeota bacterium]|nr:malectin domain-containing carbohydrate-binding protein [Candidatus Sumerlaeota bacterium]
MMRFFGFCAAGILMALSFSCLKPAPPPPGASAKPETKPVTQPPVTQLPVTGAKPELLPVTIVCPAKASALEMLAAKEIRRYAYLRTGELLTIRKSDDIPPQGDVIIVAQADRPMMNELKAVAPADSLGPDGYVLKSLGRPSQKIAAVTGAGGAGTLYAAYRFAELQLGVRFYLHGDTVPEGRIALSLDGLNERGKPLFDRRGIQPFHDFPEGPDWWNADDYKAYLAQLPKLRMNFFGLHTYPEGGVGPEPATWIGLPEDVGPDGKVKFSSQSRHFATSDPAWGYGKMKTGEYLFGADQLYDRDEYGAEYMRGMAPWPPTPEARNELFNRFGALLGDVFAFARRLEIKTCLGTETPLIVPKMVREHNQKPAVNAPAPTSAPATVSAPSAAPLAFDGGKEVAFTAPVENTEDSPLYQTVVYNLKACRVKVPNGTYAVTLKFNEPHYEEQGQRVFGVKIQGKQVIDKLDMVAQYGKNHAYDAAFKDIAVTNGELIIEFVKIVEYPFIAAIAIEGPAATLKFNCGGPDYKDYKSAMPGGGAAPKAPAQPPLTTAEIQRYYEGIFSRIMKTHPLDYYWFWTPEGWTWGGNSQKQLDDTMADMKAAIAAKEKVKAPFTLATCGWVLGPNQDRSLFDRELPKDVPLSCISRKVGNDPVELGFKKITGRPTWSIPWLEDDPGLSIPQLWAGRMRRDAMDSLEYGCTGLMGIHWRTKCLGPNVSALAQAAWDQKGFKDRAAAVATELTEGAVGGDKAKFKDPIAGTDDAPLYQDVLWGMDGYRLTIPNGTYQVTLKFCESNWSGAGQRVFSVKIQGKEVIAKLDIFAETGKNKALDKTIKDVKVTDGWLKIDFAAEVENPCIAAIAIEGMADLSTPFPARAYARKINCGGPAYKDYEADLKSTTSSRRYLAVDDFYADWARAEFGAEASKEIAAIFAKVDGHLPRPADWIGGPGGVRLDKTPWEKVAPSYAFVAELEALRSRVKGKASIARYDYWLNTFRYLRALGQMRCVWGEFDSAMAKARSEKDDVARKKIVRESVMPLRKEMVRLAGDVSRYLLATVDTPGEMGTGANIQQRAFKWALVDPGRQMENWLGEALPPDATPAKEYKGEPRLIVPTVRGSLEPGEDLRLRAMPLGTTQTAVALHWRALGSGKAFAKLPMQLVSRSVYAGALPAQAIAQAGDDIEYYIEATDAKGKTLHFPVTAPMINQTVVIMPK